MIEIRDEPGQAVCLSDADAEPPHLRIPRIVNHNQRLRSQPQRGQQGVFAKGCEGRGVDEDEVRGAQCVPLGEPKSPGPERRETVHEGS